MPDRVSAWLESLRLERYRELFEQNAITWDVLPELNDGDLASMGIVLGHRKQLLRAIAQLSKSGAGENTESPTATTAKAIEPFLSGRDQAERRQLTIMFCDLVGSTALACQLDPEDLQTAIRRFLDTCSQAISRFNGYIAKYMGDGLLVYFGYPHAYEHDAERAVHAGLAVLDLVKALPHDEHRECEIAARIGIATGHVIVGEVMGQETAKEWSVFGETPNLAARLQSLAAPNQVVVDSATKRLVGNEFEFADRGAVSLKGFKTPVHVWQVLSIKPSASRFESYRSGRIANFIGRESEIALLLARWREAVEGEGQVVLLSGEAGIGKSRLVRSLCDRLDGERYQTVQFQCSPYHASTALYPAINYLQRAAGLKAEDIPATQLQKLETFVVTNGLNDQTTVSLLADLLSIPDDDHQRPLSISSDKRKEMTLEALVQFLRRLADRCPTLFLVEDAHWLDPTTMDLLARVIARIQQMRVLLLMTLRPDFKPDWLESNHVTFLILSRLPRRHSAELLASMTGGKALPPEVQQAILTKTDGVPLYIEELTHNLLESGLLSEESDSFSLQSPVRDLAIPDSLQALLMERVDRLGPAKEIVQIGSAIGRDFSYDLLRETVDIAESHLRNALNLFVTSGLIVQEGDIPGAKFQFKHVLTQEAAYNTLPRTSRRALHARIAKILASRFSERVTVEPELLAYHYEQAGLIGPAVEHWRLAAQRDVARSANVEGLSHFDRAVHLLKDLPPGSDRDQLELALLIARGRTLMTLKGYASDDIERNYLRAKELSQGNSDSEQHFMALWGLWIYHLVRGPLVTAADLADSLHSWARLHQNQELLIRAHASVGWTASFLGRFDQAKAHLLAAMALLDPHRIPYVQDPGITVRIILARTLWILGEVDQVETLAQEAIHLARKLEHPFTLAVTLTTVSWVYSILRDADRTLSLAEEAIVVSTKYSFELPLAWATSFQGWAMLEMGQEEGLGRFLNGLTAAQAAKACLNNTYTLALLAEIYLRKKRVDEGLQAIAEAQNLVHSQGETCWYAELLRLKGELFLAQSSQLIGAAERCFSEALTIAQGQHAKMLELRAATSMAKLLRKQNKLDTAKRILGSARSRFSEQGTSPDLIEAQTILDQLSVAP